MTSPGFKLLVYELFDRLDRLIETRGERSPPSRIHPSINLHLGADEFGDSYVVTKYPGTKITVYRLDQPGGPLVSLNLTNGQFSGSTHNLALRPVVEVVRRLMILEDLANA